MNLEEEIEKLTHKINSREENDKKLAESISRLTNENELKSSLIEKLHLIQKEYES